ncbi:MAG: hypothetical protein NZ534_13165, partial [Bacteroidia bacterium]|nr:hypothetical protein [Bacteroidia bacterium]
MNDFLEDVARAARDQDSLVLVLPTPRACLFFDLRYRELFGQGAEFAVKDWETFLAPLSSLRAVDAPALVFELYKQYPGDQKPDLDLFYTWAEVIVNDFSEADANLVEADALFADVDQWQRYADPPSAYLDQADDYRRFWEILGKEAKEMKKKFVESWGTLHQLYHNFRSALEKLGWGYYGMRVRDVCRKIAEGKITPERPHWFAGFSRLSKGEAKIMRAFIGQTGQWIYDGDKYFALNDYHDAGLGY